MKIRPDIFHFFFFNDTATTEIYTLSLHDALPIFVSGLDKLGDKGNNATYSLAMGEMYRYFAGIASYSGYGKDRKSTRLNSSHGYISYAVFCLKKKKGEHQ